MRLFMLLWNGLFFLMKRNFNFSNEKLDLEIFDLGRLTHRSEYQ